MNITDDSEGYVLFSLKEKIESLIQTYNKEKDKTKRKEIRKRYKILTDKYHSTTGINVWAKTIQNGIL